MFEIFNLSLIKHIVFRKSKLEDKKIAFFDSSFLNYLDIFVNILHLFTRVWISPSSQEIAKFTAIVFGTTPSLIDRQRFGEELVTSRQRIRQRRQFSSDLITVENLRYCSIWWSLDLKKSWEKESSFRVN